MAQFAIDGLYGSVYGLVRSIFQAKFNISEKKKT